METSKSALSPKVAAVLEKIRSRKRKLEDQSTSTKEELPIPSVPAVIVEEKTESPKKSISPKKLFEENSNPEEKNEEITLDTYLQKEQELLEEAIYQKQSDWGNEKCCTYEKGYITQPVFACSTCTTSDEKFGFCYGCSMNCHVEHEVYELFDKRHFKCDCGTPRSGGNCLFNSEQRLVNNSENLYNHNFEGLYCWCNKPYQEKDIMYQCFMCFDWFHMECIERKEGQAIPNDSIPCDFICSDCSNKYSFFSFYWPLLDHSSQSPLIENPEKTCKLKQLPKAEKVGNLFLKKNWTSYICVCDECLNMYTNLNCSFVCEEEEEEGGVDEEEQPEEDLALPTLENVLTSSSIPHETKIDMINGMSELKNACKEFFAKYAESKQTVKDEDIEQFKEFLMKKRPRYE